VKLSAVSNIDFPPRERARRQRKTPGEARRGQRAPFLRRVFGEKGAFAPCCSPASPARRVGVRSTRCSCRRRRPAAGRRVENAADRRRAAEPGGAPVHSRPAPPSVAKTEAPRQEPARIETAKPTEKTSDPIAQLLGSAAPRKSDAAAGAPQKRPQEQRPKEQVGDLRAAALAKLGYALHQDGVYGGTTRQAIEKFERSNGLPVKGELSQRSFGCSARARASRSSDRAPRLGARMRGSLMRLRSDIFVAALIRGPRPQGAVAMLRRRGAAEAGTIFVKVDRLDGRRALRPRRAKRGAAPGRRAAVHQTSRREWRDPLDVEERCDARIAFRSGHLDRRNRGSPGRAFIDLTALRRGFS